MLKKLLIFFIAAFSCFLFACQADAFSISPARYLVTADPGASQTIKIKIKNDNKAGVIYRFKVLGVKQNNEGHPTIAAGIDNAESWVMPENFTVNVAAGAVKSVNFFINVPPGTPAGSHYLALAVEPASSQAGGVNLTSQLVTLLTLQISGVVQESVGILQWEAKDSVKNNKSWKFLLRLNNGGNMEVALKGSVAIRNWKGEEIFSQNINLGNQLIAGSVRSLQPEIILRGGSSYLPGLYQAQVKIIYGRTGQAASAIAYVWYFPWWSRVAGLMLFALIAAVALIIKIKTKQR